MLKQYSMSFAIPLYLLFNLSLMLHTYPCLWTIAQFTPIFKKVDKSVPSYYSPILPISCVIAFYSDMFTVIWIVVP